MPSLAASQFDASEPALSWHSPPDSAVWKKEPELTGALPERPWKAGEARPFGALPVGYETSVSMSYMLTFLGVVCVSRGLSLAGMETAAAAAQWLNVGVVLAQKQIGAWVTEISGRPLGRESFQAAGRVAKIAGQANWASLKETTGWLAAGVLNLAGARGASQKVREFSQSCLKAARDLRSQAVEESLRRPEGLSELGAWRVAREFMDKGMPGAAAKIWLARPFNPSWKVNFSFHGQKMGVSFKEALEATLTRPAQADQARYVEQTLRVMGSVSERLELGASTPEPDQPKASAARARL